MRRHDRGSIITLGIAALLLCGSLRLAAQSNTTTEANLVDCTLDGIHHTCNRSDFLRAVAQSHTVALQSQPKDRIADGLMASLVHNLSKDVATPPQPADLAWHLVRTQSEGFDVGTGDRELATLRIFSTKGTDSRLLWVETYRGQPDTPWPAAVRAITRQLQITIAGAKP